MLYDLLASVHPTKVVLLNRAVAVAMVAGPERGLTELEQLEQGGELDRYHLFHAARADFLRRLGRAADALQAHERARWLKPMLSNDSWMRESPKRNA